MLTDGEEETVSVDGGHELLNEQSQQRSADQCQVEVVNHEQRVQFERGTILHELTAAEDDDVVRDQGNGGSLERRHRRDAFNETELAGGIAHDGLEGLIEDGP